MLKRITITLFITLLMCFSLLAQNKAVKIKNETVSTIPAKISYQGVLTDNNGDLVADGSYSMQFALYDAETGGTLLWSETQSSVIITDGIFNVQLGSQTVFPSNLSFDAPYWLQVTVSGIVLTRIELTSSAYSFNTSRIQGQLISSSLPSSGQVLKWDGSQWISGNDNLSLPYSTLYTGNTEYAISISNQGSGGIAEFNKPGPNVADVLYVSQDGNGRAARFKSGSSNANYAVDIDSWSNTKAALYVNNSGSGGAAYFDGKVHVNGTFTSSDKQFMIDHPFDPENKILRHSCIESPDMMNVYNGNINTDASGFAVIQLPDYFSALNKDFRYQLTVVGQFAQAIVTNEIQNNNFKIQTDKPNVKVSWQVTGIRKDPWAENNRIVVEELKSSDTRGYYLNPKAYGQPMTRSVEYATHPEIFEQNQIVPPQVESRQEK